jgi:hypothetical protein
MPFWDGVLWSCIVFGGFFALGEFLHWCVS